MQTGSVRWFNTIKGYGFISPDGGGNDIFVHGSALEAAGVIELKDGDKIGYKLTNARDGREIASELQLL